jgi:hypothetical protein
MISALSLIFDLKSFKATNPEALATLQDDDTLPYRNRILFGLDRAAQHPGTNVISTSRSRQSFSLLAIGGRSV